METTTSGNDYLSIIGSIITIISFLAMIFQWLYYNKISVYVFVNKFLKRLQEVTFDVSFTYKVPKDIDIYPMIEKELKEIYRIKSVNKEMNLKNHKMYNLENFFLKVQVDSEINSDTESNEIFISIPKIKVTYKSVETILEELDRLSQRLSKVLKCSNELYSIDIRYSKSKNPFFGFAIQRFGKNAVNHFTCEINCEILTNGKDENLFDKKATIYKEYLNVTEKNFSDLRRIAKYLLLLN